MDSNSFSHPISISSAFELIPSIRYPSSSSLPFTASLTSHPDLLPRLPRQGETDVLPAAESPLSFVQALLPENLPADSEHNQTTKYPQSLMALYSPYCQLSKIEFHVPQNGNRRLVNPSFRNDFTCLNFVPSNKMPSCVNSSLIPSTHSWHPLAALENQSFLICHSA